MSKPGVAKMLRQSDQLRELEWFDKVAIGAALQGDFFPIWEFRARQYNDWQTIKPWLSADPVQKR